MHISIKIFIALLFLNKLSFANYSKKTGFVLINPITITKPCFQDTANPKVQSGFYLVFNDTSKKQGFKLYAKEEYYFLNDSPSVKMEQVDTLYKELNTNINRYMLIFKFNEEATKNWFFVYAEK